jgi:hypothetical protein
MRFEGRRLEGTRFEGEVCGSLTEIALTHRSIEYIVEAVKGGAQEPRKAVGEAGWMTIFQWFILRIDTHLSTQ